MEKACPSSRAFSVASSSSPSPSPSPFLSLLPLRSFSSSPPPLLIRSLLSACHSPQLPVSSKLRPWIQWHNILGNKNRSLPSHVSLLLKGASFKPCRCRRHWPVACISSAVVSGAGGGGDGFGGGVGGGGNGGGGDGFKASATGAQAVGAESDDFPPASSADDIIILDVGGMSCGGCASSVKRILESQPHVTFASVNLATEMAIVRVTRQDETAKAWDVTKQELGEVLAKHLTSCGFKSSVREEVVGG